MRERRAVARVEEPLARYAQGFRACLAERGYRPSSVEDQVWLMAHFSWWMAQQGLQPSAFTADAVERFQRCWATSAVSAPCRSRPRPTHRFERVVAEYREYLGVRTPRHLSASPRPTRHRESRHAEC